jgi:uncharacterized protein
MNIFVDSSILIEYIKGKGITFLNEMVDNHILLTNQIVASEFLYKYIGIALQKSPLSAKESSEIKSAFTNNIADEILKILNYLPGNEKITKTAIEYMKKYNLLPNDSIILSTCKENNIQYLATYDSDFIGPCKNENISIL